MSKKVDERVVEMRFDNKDFESNVKTTMSTLDRLKAALKLPTSSKSLDGVANAAKNSTSNISGLGSAVETVNARFSAMQVVGMTALSNITSAALRAGANLVKSFTIEPITSGFREYELQMNSIQTILANTKSKGTTMSDVTAALDELNEYADLTIYNFAEMTKNIGTFTAAGVDLDTSVGAIKGIANLGAMSSSTSVQVSTAMYQLSQALATGRVSLMDWNSVVNAGMGGEQFQNALKRTAKNFGYDVDGMIKKYGSFRESLTQGGWLTAEVLNETLNQIGGAYDATALKAKGYSDQQIRDILDLADTATKAATEVKTFTQLMDTLKEAAGSGFAKMWQNIFGDFEQAKEFFSGLHETLEPLVTGPIDALNSVIEGAMGGGGSRWSEFEQELKDAGSSVEDFQKKLSDVYKTSTGGSLDKLIEEYGSLEKAIASGTITSEMMTQALGELRVSTEKVTGSTKSLAEWQKVVDDVWRGDYGNIDTGRMERLAAAGWEYAEVQKLVNMTVDGHRLTLEDLSKAQLISLGYTEEQSAALAELAKEASATGSDLNTLINDLVAPKKSGRELFLEGLTNILQAIIKPLQAVGDAFSAVFGMNSDDLYGIIESFNKFSKTLIMNGDTLDNITRTAKGLFSVLHLVGTFVGKGFTFGFKAVNKVLGLFGTNLLDVTAILGDALFSLDKWLTSGETMESIFDGIGTAISWIIGPISNFVDSVAGFPVVSSLVIAVGDAFNWLLEQIHAFAVAPWKNNPIEGIKNTLLDAYDALKNLTWDDVLSAASSFGAKFREIFSKLKEKFEELGPDIIEGFQNGLKDGWDKILEFLGDMAERAIELVKAILGIQSPSTVFFEIGKNIIEGLCNGIQYLSGSVSDTIYAIVEDIKYALSGVDWGVVLPVAGAVGSFAILYQMTDALQGFAQAAKDLASPAKSLSNLGGSLKTTVDGFNNMMGFTQNTTSIKFKQMAEGVKILAESIAILVASVGALTLVDQSKLVGAVVVIGALAAIIGVLAVVLARFASGGKVLESLQINATLLSLGGTFALLAVSAKILSGIDEAGYKNAFDMITLFAAVVATLIIAASAFGPRVGQASAFLTNIGTAFLLLGVAARLLGGMDQSSISAAQEMIVTFTAVVAALMLATFIGGPRAGAAIEFLSQIGKAFVLLGVAARLLGGMDASSMRVAQEMLISFAGVVGLLMTILFIGGPRAGAAIQYLSQIGIAFLALGVAARLLGGLSKEQLETAKDALYAFVGVISVLMIIGSLAKGVSKGVASSILSMSLAIGILAGVAVLLGYVQIENLERGVAIVTVFGLLVSLMAQSARGVRDIKGTMMGIAVAIGVMAAAVAVLSFIEPDKLYTATSALAFLILSLSTAIAASGKAATKVGPIIAMVFAIAALGGVVGVLASMNPEAVLPSAVALSVLMLAMAGALRILDDVYSISKDAYQGLIVLVGVTALLAVILGAMSALNVEGSITSAISMGILLNAMAASLLILDQVKSISMTAIGTMYLLILVVGALGQIIGSMNGLNPVASIGNAVALGALLGAMATSLLILDQVKSISTTAIGTAFVLTLVVGALSVIIGSMNELNPAASIGNALALGILINALVIAASILGMTSAFIAGAAAALGPLGAVMVGLTTIVAAAGAIALIPGAQWLVSNGAGFLAALGNAIGGFVGGIVGGALAGLTSGLPQIGTNLSGFAENLKPFVETIGNIDPSIADSLGALAAGLVAFTGAGFLDNLTAFFSGGASGIEQIATNLPLLGIGLAGFAMAIAPITNIDRVATGANAFKALAEAMATVPNSGGWLGEILGGKDYSSFATGMEDIGNGLAKFDAATTDVSVDTIQTRVGALKTVMDALSGVPNTGGWLQMLLGEQDWENYSNGMEAMGNGLVAFSDATADLKTETIAEKVNALKLVMEALSSVPNSGGFLQNLLGEQDWTNYSNGMAQIGLGLRNFATYTGSIEDVTHLNSVIESLKALIIGFSEIPSEGGMLDQLFGDGTVDYQKFAQGIVQIGLAMGGFAIATMAITDTAKLSGVVNSTRAIIDGLASIELSDTGLLGSMMNGGATFTTFGTSLGSLGNSIAAFGNAVAEASFDNVSAAIAAANSILSFVNKTAEIDTSGIESFKSAVDALAEVNVAALVETFSGATTDLGNAGKGLVQAVADGLGKNESSLTSAADDILTNLKNKFDNAAADYYNPGQTLINKFVEGISSIGSSIGNTIDGILSDAKMSANSKASEFKDVGNNIALGVRAGINEYAGEVARAAAQMVTDAKNAANAAADSHSPSRVFRYEVAAYMGQGMVLGLKDYQPVVGREGGNLGRSAIDGLRASISRMSSVLNSDLDVNPTIRPVMDLSDVKNGADQINGMLNNVDSLGISHATRIDSMMNSRIQNGSFNDVVNAVDRLRGALNNVGNTTYTVNGVTYDDGTNIAVAVGDLTRAIRLERRV